MDPYCRYLKLIAIIAVIYTQPGKDILMMNDIATLSRLVERSRTTYM